VTINYIALDRTAYKKDYGWADMDKDRDQDLLSQLTALSEAASENREKLADLKVISASLAKRFPHRSAEQIEAKAKCLWRYRGLHWRE
jgi:hypothetical protein